MDGPLAFGALGGVGVQYRLRRDWSVGAAVLIGKKNYVAGRDQIHMSEDLFVDAIAPSKTTVSATILEFPVTLTYTSANRKGNVAWFANAGLNSFKFLSDDMRFTYAEERPDQLHHMRDGQPGGAFASSVRLGGGVSVAPMRLPSFTVGPYLEVPLRRTGYSEVSLYTMGVQLQIGLGTVR